jgi:two-component system, OmpR family, phosphate regulon sensor histidine kinase PhoR
MLSLSFRTKLLASHVGLVIAVMVIALFALNQTLVADLRRQLDQRLLEQAKGAAIWVGEGRRHPDKLAERLALIVKADVTIFSHSGEVLGDSSAHTANDGASEPPAVLSATPENDAHAAEVVAAMGGGMGRASRTISSGEEMRYVAVPAADGLVLRLGFPLAEIHATVLAMQRRLLFASALAIVLALGLGFLASQFAARPLLAMTGAARRIAQGDYDVDLRSTSPDEFGLLSRTLATLASELKARIGDLVAERDRLTAILAGMAEGVVVVGATRQIVMANPAASEILGAVLVGSTLDAAVTDPALHRFMVGGGSASDVHDSEVETAAGRSIAIYVRPLAASNGSVMVLRDMTRMRRLLTMRRDFVANVSHELRTPVTSIQGYAETLLEQPADATTHRQFLEIIHRQAQRIGALVADLLTLSELETRPSEELVREPVHLASLSAHVVETLRGRALQKEAHVKVEVGDEVRALGDPTGLEQVIQNLVDNALKYGRSGGEVGLRGVVGGGRVVLTVSDNGPGIAREHLPRLFERFYRVDAGRSRDQGGTGLGLAIVKHLVESMGGAIHVSSDAGHGTTFRVELPSA